MPACFLGSSLLGISISNPYPVILCILDVGLCFLDATEEWVFFFNILLVCVFYLEVETTDFEGC